MFFSPLVLSWLSGAIFLLLDGRKGNIAWLGAALMIATAAADLALLGYLVFERERAFEVVTGGWPQGVGIRLRIDLLSLFFASLCALVLAAVMVHEARARKRFRLFPALVLFLSTGLHGAFFTGDLFNFYVFFELSVITSFALAAYGYGRREIRGAFVYVVVNLFGSVLFLIAVATIYHTTGTLDLDQLAAGVAETGRGTLVVPAAVLFTGLSIKLGLFPFHGWLPVLYGNARPAVATALAGALANVGAYGLLRIGFTALNQARDQGAFLLLFIGSVAAIYGALLAIRRSRPADVAAYAAIVHAGYIVLALGIGGLNGIAALLLIVISGSLDKSTIFLSLEAPTFPRGLASFVAGSSVAGLPITAGFFAKVQLFRAALEAPAGWAIASALFASSVLLMGAVLRLWWLSERSGPRQVQSGASALALAGALLLVGLWPDPVVGLVSTIAETMIGGGT